VDVRNAAIPGASAAACDCRAWCVFRDQPRIACRLGKIDGLTQIDEAGLVDPDQATPGSVEVDYDESQNNNQHNHDVSHKGGAMAGNIGRVSGDTARHQERAVQKKQDKLRDVLTERGITAPVGINEIVDRLNEQSG
jgi:hypothetical protein